MDTSAFYNLQLPFPAGGRQLECNSYSGMNYNNGMGGISSPGSQGSAGNSHQQTSAEADSNGYQNWNGSPSSTLSYTQTMQPPSVSDLRNHPGYCESYDVTLTLNQRILSSYLPSKMIS
jgi:hypothetical protein